MIVSREQLVHSVPRRRWLEVIAGLTIGIIGGTMLLGGLVCACLMVVIPGRDPPVLAAALTIAMGVPCPFLAWRLVTGRMRKKDGGFFSPTELRVAGIYFALSPLIAINNIWFVEWVLGSLSCATACFALARHRSNAIRTVLNGGDLACTTPNTDQPQSPPAADQPGG